MALSWISINANDGSVIADLPNLEVGGELRLTLMQYETQTVHLPLDDAPDNWRQATRKGAVFLVALDEDERPIWGGLVIRRSRITGDGVSMTLITPEGYFDRVYVGDQDYPATPRNQIAKSLVETYARTGAKRGIPIRGQIVGDPGVLHDGQYRDAHDKTLYSSLLDLSSLDGGPEWTVGWERVDELKLGMVFYVGNRIGAVPTDGLAPAAHFEMPGPVNSAELLEGYGTGEGANDVRATSSPEEDEPRPESPAQRTTTDQRPRFEYRWSPDTTAKLEVPALTSHAQRALASMKDGILAFAMSCSREDAPQFGVDWNLGDDIGFEIESPEFPDKLSGAARCIGVQLSENSVTPILDVTNIEGID